MSLSSTVRFVLVCFQCVSQRFIRNEVHAVRPIFPSWWTVKYYGAMGQKNLTHKCLLLHVLFKETTASADWQICRPWEEVTPLGSPKLEGTVCFDVTQKRKEVRFLCKLISVFLWLLGIVIELDSFSICVAFDLFFKGVILCKNLLFWAFYHVKMLFLHLERDN